MRRTMKSVVVPMMALAVMVMFSSFSRAEDAPKTATGTITGKVVDADGKPVSAALVQLATPASKGNANAPHDANAHATDQKLAPADAGNDSGNADKPAAKGDKAKGGMRNLNIINSTNTDGDGKFTFANVQPGDYLVVTNVKGQGRAREKVTVAAGDSKELELKLAVPKAKTPKS